MALSTFSSSELTKYTNGYCYLLSWILKEYFELEKLDVQIVELVEGTEVIHSLICVLSDNTFSNRVFLDICGKYSSEQNVLEMWEIISPSEEERTLRYLPKEIEKVNWWKELGIPYTLREQKETEEFVINHSSTFNNILFGKCIIIEECKKIKDKLWDDEASFEIDVQDVIKNILTGNHETFLGSLESSLK